MTVKFISYDGSYPNLCAGTLVLEVDGKTFTFPNHALCSGGYVSFDKDWNEDVGEGEWNIHKWPDDFPAEAKGEALDVVNSNVRHGCCGGCV